MDPETVGEEETSAQFPKMGDEETVADEEKTLQFHEMGLDDRILEVSKKYYLYMSKSKGSLGKCNLGNCDNYSYYNLDIIHYI